MTRKYKLFGMPKGMKHQEHLGSFVTAARRKMAI